MTIPNPVGNDGLFCLFVVPPTAACDSAALEAAAGAENGYHPVFLCLSNNFSSSIEAFVAGAGCLRMEYSGEFPKLCGLKSSMMLQTARSRNAALQGIYNFPYKNDRPGDDGTLRSV